MYKSPIELITAIQNAVEDDVYKAILKTDVKVNKIELMKALRYDRDQYEKGYDDCRRSFLIGKRGRWKCSAIGRYACSLCGGEPCYDGNIFEYKYCPYCGADMRGAKDD